LLLKIFFGLPQESEILRNGNRVCFKLLLWANRQTADSDPFFIKSNIELFINGSRNNHINLPLIRKQLLQTCAARSEKPAYSVQDFSSQIWQIIRTILLALVPSVLGSVLVALFHI
jgi:hypothetical protein